LLSTGDARLVEVATVDNAVNRLWGEVKGVGKNMLGTLLMEVRNEIRASLELSGAKKKKAPQRKSNSKGLAA
jgi:hypothetical protein